MSESTERDTDIEKQIDDATDAVVVQTRALDELEPTAGDTAAMGLGHFMDVPVQITVEVGRTRMTLAELVRLGPGSLVTLDRESHEPADVLVNGKVVAHGEIVTIKESYGIRITKVVRN